MAIATPTRRKDERKAAVTYRVQPETRTRVKLLADALGLEQSLVIDEAIAQLTQARRDELQTHIREIQASLDAKLRDQTPAEVLTGIRRKG